jgi:hypothetical protein
LYDASIGLPKRPVSQAARATNGTAHCWVSRLHADARARPGNEAHSRDDAESTRIVDE